jgi:NAD(P)-dependent dehydrogenase (short-subunit alcohol dehydrogenase family)
MARRFEGAAVLVTGAGSGIGRATALRFAREGASAVALIDNHPGRLAAVTREIGALGARAVPIDADVAYRESCVAGIRDAIAEIGAPRITVSNVGASSTAGILDLDIDAWHHVMDTNLTASVIVGQEVARAMVAAKAQGVILYTSSAAGHGGVPGIASYTVSKAAIRTLVANMALELGPYGIRVVAVSPGWTDTPGSEEIQGEEVSRRFREEGFPYAALGRVATPDDIAGLYAFLASDDGSYVSGTNVTIDGGLTAPAFQMPAESVDIRGHEPAGAASEGAG